VRFWLLLDLPQNSRQDRRVNYLIEKSGKVVEMQIDNDAVAPTKIVTLCERRKTKNNAPRGRDRTLFQASARPHLRSLCRCARLAQKFLHRLARSQHRMKMRDGVARPLALSRSRAESEAESRCRHR
jgi:hypothetical protein